jgi:DNA repair protein RAD5
MESDKLALMMEVLGSEADPQLVVQVLRSSKGRVEQAIEAYLQQSQMKQAFMTKEPTKRKRNEADSDWPKLLGFFESQAFAVSHITGLKVNEPVELKYLSSKPTPAKKRGKSKENVDRTIRLLIPSISSVSIAKLPQSLCEVLQPLLSARFIEISAFVSEAVHTLRILDTMKIVIQVSICPTALSNPTDKAAEELAKLDVSNEEYIAQREAFGRLFGLLSLVKTQSALIEREVLSNEGLPIEAGQLEHIQKLLQLETAEDQELTLTEPAESFTAELYPYQKQALTWMLERETHCEVSSKNRELHHLWEEYKTSDGSRIYFNPCTGQVSVKFPSAGEQCRGGILADEMGLGKTIMMAALVHTHRPSQVPTAKRPKLSKVRGGTLIVVPLSLLSQWMAELENNGTSLTITEYYGQAKKSTELERFDVVLSTSGTVSSDFTANGPLYQVNWFRVVLDEGHNIRNRSTAVAKACFKLTSTHKWVVTGTPVQNSLDDLFSLVHFLDIEPWSDYLWWNRMINKPSLQNEVKCFEILRKLLKPIVLRRTKATKLKNGASIVDLPVLEIQTEVIDLLPDEQEIYTLLHQRSKQAFEYFLAEGKQRTFYASVFEMILRLRQICDHPYLIMSRGDVTSKEQVNAFLTKLQGEETLTNPQYLIEIADKVRGGEDMECPICLEAVEDAVMAPCAHAMCRVCAYTQVDRNGNCPLCKRPLRQHELTTVPRESKFSFDIAANFRSSAKIDRLIEILQTSQETTVVFTQWTSMLDLVEIALSQAQITFSRLDGSMSRNRREASLVQLRSGQVQVMLLSLRAGGVGLNLTAASRVILLDPWWNPAVEQQAIERVHRIGQTRPVVATRLICRNTVEEGILKLQDNKRKLMEGALEGSKASLSLENIQFIFDNALVI